MSKRIIAFLVTIALVMSMLPLAALAEEESTVTPEEVGAAIDQAQSSAVEAGVANGLSGEVQTAADEALAALNEQMAENKLNAAESIVEGTDADNAERAEDAKEAAEDAADAADKAKEDAQAAADAKEEAKEALEEAKDATSKGEAVNAAEKAEEASAAADEAAKDAWTQSNEAAKKAEEAKAAYEAAKQAADEADAAVKALLESGVGDMVVAQEKAAEAAKLAEAKHQEMLAAQTAAKAAAEAAQAEVDTAKKELDAAAKELEEAIKEHAPSVAEKGTAAFVTGAALVASKVAVEIAGQVVESYEGDLADLEQQVDELETAIGVAGEAILVAEGKLNSDKLGDAEYQSALAELETAKAAQKEAEAALEMSKKLLDAKNDADSELAQQKSEIDSLQETVAKDPTNTAAVVELTEKVLGNEFSDDKLGEITWVNKDEGVFSVKDENGVTQYYKAVPTQNEEDGTYYLQFCKAVLDNPKVTTDLPSAKEQYTGEKTNGATQNTVYTVRDGDNTYTVQIKCTITKSPLTGKIREDYTYEANGKTVYYDVLTKTFRMGFTAVTVVDTSQSSYVPGAPLKTNSNTLDNKWDNAETNVESNEQTWNTAVENAEQANQKFEAVHETYKEAEADLEKMKGEQVSRQETVDNLNQQVAELDKKLNGGVADQIIRLTIGNMLDVDVDITIDKDDVLGELDDAKEIGRVWLKQQLGEALTEEEQALLDKLNAVDTGKEIVDIVTGLQDGVDLDDVKNTIDLLANSGVSAKTREAILKAVEKTLAAAHKKAAEELIEAIEDAKQDIAEKGKTAGDAALKLANKELALADATAKAALAEAAVDNAANLKELADKAQQDAEKALEEYKKLFDSYGTNSDLVKAAEAAYYAARDNAVNALAAAKDASRKAIAAAKAALEARKIADNFPEESSKTTYSNTGLTIAKYAYSLLGPLMPGFSQNNDAMTNAEFVKLVYAHFGITLDLSSAKPEDVAKNGVRIDSKLAKAGDLVCIHANDGTVGTFGIYYGEGSYVFFNETTREVELGKTAQITNGWFVVRVIK